MLRTAYKDKSGNEIFVGSKVLYKGEIFEVIINDFNSRLAIDNDMGQCWLSSVYRECEVIQ